MTIILFLIDTSSSMNQRTFLGARPTLLDVAKDAVEKFLKARARDIASRGDRYMLLTFEDPPHNIKAGWKESHAVFMNELKHLTACGVTNMGSALKNAFDLLNLNRMQSGIDMYGLGRAPYYLEPSMIIVITDGSSLTHMNGVQQTLELPMQNHAVPGSELTREPFRWDQRLFSLVLRLTGTPPADNGLNLNHMPPDHSQIGAMCAVTSGRSYTITNQRSILQSIDALVQKVQSGVVIQFEKVGPDPPPIDSETPAITAATTTATAGANIANDSSRHPNPDPKENNTAKQSNGSTDTSKDHNSDNNQAPNHEHNDDSTIQQQQAHQNSHLSAANNKQAAHQIRPINDTSWHSTRSLIYVHRSLQKNFPVGHWPIPEAYWPDPNLASLPPRTAHPIVKFTCVATEPHMLDTLPFDKYELESSPLTQYILSRKQPHVAWQVYVSNSGKQPGDLGAPFGYLKAATNLNCVNLFVMPYNYPVLLPTLEEILKKNQLPSRPYRDMRPGFEDYVKCMPPYYATPLKRALARMGLIMFLGGFVPDNLESNCFSHVVHGKLKNHKSEAKAQFDRLIQSMQHATKNQNHDAVRVLLCGNNLRSQVESTSYCNMACTGKPTQAFNIRYSTMKSELNEFPNFVIRVRDKVNAFNSNENMRIRHTFRNPYDIERKDLIDQIHLMRANFMQSPSRIKYKDEDQIHTLPVSQMGNYQDYLKRQPTPLREIESTPVRQHMFGNPFKIDKKGMMVDEADSMGLADFGSPLQKNKKISSNHRRRGPIPKDFILLSKNSWQRSLSTPPSLSPAQSPKHSMTDEDSNDSISVSILASVDQQNGKSLPLQSASTVLMTPMSLPATPPLNTDNGDIPVDHILHLHDDTLNNVSNNSTPDNESTTNNKPIRPSEQDLALRSDIFKHIRGPGMNYASVLKTISKLQGEKRKFILEETIREAKRFKKVRLLHQLNLIGRQ